MSEYRLEMRGVCKSFPGVKALDHAQLHLRPGTVHALMGENGAGKSTLMKCMFGIYKMDEGEIIFEGQKVSIADPMEALKMGIAMVHQELQPIPARTVGENIFLGRYPMKRALGFIPIVDHKRMYEETAALLKKVRMDFDPRQMLGELSVSQMQSVEIAKAVSANCKVLILDEPTSSLDDSEVEKLFKVMRQLKSEGVGIVFVTHFLEQVYALCDRITVLRNGTLVGEYPIADLPRVKLVAAMMGKDFDDLASIKPEGFEAQKDAPLQIEARGLSHKGTIKPFDLDIHKGEVIGLTGLLGSGRSELARSIYGADKAQTGTLKVGGKDAKISQPLDAMNLGMGLLPDDRKAEGIIGELSVRENIILAMQAKRGMFRQLSRAKQEEIADEYIKLLQIKTATRETPIKQLSGGNQQKAILGRWLATDPDFLILDEPTRGIDIGTKTEIQKLIIQLSQEGKSIMFISSEIEEMLRTCNRMAVLRDGAKVGELDGELTQERVMAAIAGGADND